MRFPTVRPSGANFVRPLPDETVELSPPGFSWWRASDRGACHYKLVVERAGASYYESPELQDPIHVPTKVFSPGVYHWVVQAVDSGSVMAETERRSFTVSESAPEQPWTDPVDLLANVSVERPRLFFLASQMDAVRESLTTTRSGAFKRLARAADEALKLDCPAEPDYDQLEDPAERRLAYKACFGEMRRYHDQGMRSLALMYLLTGERKYGEEARKLIVDAAGWDPEGISSILAPYGDEVGLGLLRVGAEVYDWIYDLLSDAERDLVARMVGARADQMIRQLEKSDYTFKPEGSHNGRLPGFLLEHAVALAEDERAIGWTEYALKVIATNFPHWAGHEGGWAQGVPYGMSYNSRDAMPFHAWALATGHDIWLKPYYQKMPWFFYYCVSPVGELMPFGDTEHQPVRSSAGTFLQFHGLRLNNHRLYHWADHPDGQSGHTLDPFPGILLENIPPEQKEDTIPQDRAFRGIGWGALHSDIENPDRDFMVLFRSSPFGGVSHGHASQNDFAVMKGGRALICAGGLRFPHHGTPFHNEYAQQSISHNCVLVNGEGAINRDGNRGGEIVGFETSEAFGYVSGEAENAYGYRLNKCRRHMLLIRPSILLLVDELEAPEASTYQWLLHAFEKFSIDTDAVTVTSRRKGTSLKGQLFASCELSIEQTDDWLVAPNKGYPTYDGDMPDKRWHFTAESEERARCRIAAVFSVRGPDEEEPDYTLEHSNQMITVTVDGVSAKVALDENASNVLSVTSNTASLEI